MSGANGGRGIDRSGADTLVRVSNANTQTFVANPCSGTWASVNVRKWVAMEASLRVRVGGRVEVVGLWTAQDALSSPRSIVAGARRRV